MTYSKPNSSAATGTKLRIPNDSCPFSGMCVVCLEGCTGFCEIGHSAIREREALYPQPFGKITAGAQKDYPVDFSHFNISGTCIGAEGVEANPDVAIFQNVDITTAVRDIKLNVPWFTTGLGSTNVARTNWEGVAIGCALSGTMVGIGENICGVDPDSEFKAGRIVKSPEMERRIKLYQQWKENGVGAVIVQENVEDSRLGVLEYVIEKLGVEFVEIKWGQGAKNIGGEIKLPTVERAKELKNRGYLVYPDPTDPEVEETAKKGGIKEFERHSRLGMVSYESFMNRVEQLRKAGAKYISLKTGSYRPKDLALALKCASDGKIDLLIVDGSGGGTGMSPWRMMNEWGIPTVYLEALTYRYCEELKKKGKYIPPIAMAGGFVLEDQILKGLALGAPYIKLIAMGRSTITAAMVGRTIGELIKDGRVPTEYKKYGDTVEQIFLASTELKEKLGKDFTRLSPAAIGVYSYYSRLATGLKQFMAGLRKFQLELTSRDDIFSLTKEAEQVTGIPYIMDYDSEAAVEILK